MKRGDKVKLKRSWWKQLTYRGTIYSMTPGQPPKLNKTGRFNQWLNKLKIRHWYNK